MILYFGEKRDVRSWLVKCGVTGLRPFFTSKNNTMPKLPDIPLRKLKTKLNWEDLILNTKSLSLLKEIELWYQHRQTLNKDWGFENRLKPGFCALFSGPSGTGKTLAATLLGKSLQQEVYQVNLPMTTSKYIGETEKNLSRIFKKATSKGWILFFDEADALFGKSGYKQAHQDQYANQEVSYLLQRIEDFAGLVIFAIDNDADIPQTFKRRFSSIIHFPLPAAKERLLIWEKGIPDRAQLAPDIDLKTIAKDYELTGEAIIKVLHFTALKTLERGNTTFQKKDLTEGIKRAMRSGF